MAIAEARKQVSQMGYDPYNLKDYTQSVGIFTVTSSYTWITGLASFYRMGNITITMENGIVSTILEEIYSIELPAIVIFYISNIFNEKINFKCKT